MELCGLTGRREDREGGQDPDRAGLCATVWANVGGGGRQSGGRDPDRTGRLGILGIHTPFFRPTYLFCTCFVEFYFYSKLQIFPPLNTVIWRLWLILYIPPPHPQAETNK